MKKYILIAAAVATMGLTACGSSVAPTATVPAAGVVSLSGVVSKGPIAGGTVTVTDANGVVIGTATTDAYGAYNVRAPWDAVGPFSLTISGGKDTVTGVVPDFPVKTIVAYVANNTFTQVNANANVFSTVIAAAATAASGGKLPTAAELKKQETTLIKNLGMGLKSGVTPSNDVTVANAATVIAANEALAEVIRRSSVSTAKKAGAGAASSADMVNTIASLAADISDGVMDGSASPAAISGAIADTGATNVTQASVTSSTATTAAQAGSVIVEAFKNGGSVNVTNTSGVVAILAATVKVSLETAVTKAVAAVAKSYAQGSAAAIAQAPASAPAKIVVPAPSSVISQTSTASSVTAKVAATAATAAKTATAAAVAGATAAQIATAKQATADAFGAAQAAAQAATNNSNAATAVVTAAGAAVTTAQTAAVTTAQTAATTAATTANKAGVADGFAQAGNLAAAQKAAAQAAIDALAQVKATASAALNAAALKASTGVAIVGNIITIGGVAVPVNGMSIANMPAGTTVKAAGLTMNIPLMDYYGSLATPVVAPVQMIIYDTRTARRINATLLVTLSSTNGIVNITVPTGNALNYSARTAAMTVSAGKLVASTAIRAAQGTLIIDIAGLAAQIPNLVIKPGTYGFNLGLGNVTLGFDNATSTGILNPLPTNIAGQGIYGTFTVQ